MAVPLWSAMDTKNDEKSQKQTWTLTVHSEGSFFLNKPGLNTPHNFLGNQKKNADPFTISSQKKTYFC